MSIRKLARSGLFVLAMYGLMVAPTNAVTAFYIADVIVAGEFDISGTALPMIQVTDRGGAFTNRFFVISNVIGREGLAVGLSAIALGKPVQMQVDIAQTPSFNFSVITGIFLAK